MNPPPKPGTPQWNITTSSTAIPRMPSMSGRKPLEGCWETRVAIEGAVFLKISDPRVTKTDLQRAGTDACGHIAVASAGARRQFQIQPRQRIDRSCLDGQAF